MIRNCFFHAGRGIELTDAGALFLTEARAVLARVEAAELVSEVGGLRRGTVAVQASQTVASYWLPCHLQAFRHAHPGIDIRIGVGNTAQGCRRGAGWRVAEAMEAALSVTRRTQTLGDQCHGTNK